MSIKSTKNQKRNFPSFVVRKEGTGDSWDSTVYEVDKELEDQFEWFGDWILNKRPEVERNLWRAETEVAKKEPAARMAMSCLGSPKDSPLIVVDFAEAVLCAMDLRRDLDLLNSVYHVAMTTEKELLFCAREGAQQEQFSRLWDWFLAELEERYGFREKQKDMPSSKIPDPHGWNKIGEVWPQPGDICELASPARRYLNECWFDGKLNLWLDRLNGNKIDGEGNIHYKGQEESDDRNPFYTHFRLVPRDLPKADESEEEKSDASVN